MRMKGRRQRRKDQGEGSRVPVSCVEGRSHTPTWRATRGAAGCGTSKGAKPLTGVDRMAKNEMFTLISFG